MATFRKRSNSWQARVQRHGYPDQSKSFKSYADAVAWARKLESEIDLALPAVCNQTIKALTIRDLLVRYREQVSCRKKHSDVESYRIGAWLKHPIADKSVMTLRSADIALWRDERIKVGRSPNTIRLELAILSNMFTIAASEWGYEWLANPTNKIKLPKLPSGRVRRVQQCELKMILSHSDSPVLESIATLAIETGMRRGELASLEGKNFHQSKRTLLIPITKNGEAREIPLSPVALEIVSDLASDNKGRLFDITSHAISVAFGRACKRAGLEDIHFHDLRHEAISRFFEMGLSIPEVASISGHKTWTMLRRYTHLSAEKIAAKLQ